jgi:hypothetical protein
VSATTNTRHKDCPRLKFPTMSRGLSLCRMLVVVPSIRIEGKERIDLVEVDTPPLTHTLIHIASLLLTRTHSKEGKE